MFQSKSILVILLLAVSQLAAAGSSLNRATLSERAVKHRTNAARMAAGLGPLPPAEILRRHGGGGGGGPHGPGNNFPGNPQTPTQPNPPKPSQGRPDKPDCDDKHNVPIKCKKKGSGEHVGYVGKDWSKKGKRGFGLCKDKRDALNLDFENSVTPFDFKISKGGDFPFLGFAGNNLKPGSPDSAVLTGTRKTNRENSPSNVGNAFPGWAANSESQVWYYTRANKSVTSKWFNQGGISVESKIFYDPEDDLFHLVTDTNAFKRKCPDAFEVELEVEDDD